ncbi:zinc ABC transporter substrate-binding protein [Peptostreptococcaceae bacterium AGR-M142]
MKKTLKILLAIMVLLVFTACTNEEKQEKQEIIKISSSILPIDNFVKKVGGNLVETMVMIPPGASPANYQPTPREMSMMSESSLYFSVGVATEATNIIPAVNQANVKIINLDKKVKEIYEDRYFDAIVEHEEEHHEEEHSHGGRDPHIWMSPKRAIVIVDQIQRELINLDPKNKEIYEANAKAYKEELIKLDESIKNTLSNYKNKTFIIMHPSLGYFADDYNLNMVAIEKNGKEATASHLQKVIEFAKSNDIHVVFYQAEFDSQQANVIANEIDGEVKEIAPLSPNYIDNLNEIIKAFEEALKE